MDTHIAGLMKQLEEENAALKAELKQANLAVEALNICIKQDDEREAELRLELAEMLAHIKRLPTPYDALRALTAKST